MQRMKKVAQGCILMCQIEQRVQCTTTEISHIPQMPPNAGGYRVILPLLQEP